MGWFLPIEPHQPFSYKKINCESLLRFLFSQCFQKTPVKRNSLRPSVTSKSLSCGIAAPNKKNQNKKSLTKMIFCFSVEKLDFAQ